jgi:hypothetical protein
MVLKPRLPAIFQNQTIRPWKWSRLTLVSWPTIFFAADAGQALDVLSIRSDKIQFAESFLIDHASSPPSARDNALSRSQS